MSNYIYHFANSKINLNDLLNDCENEIYLYLINYSYDDFMNIIDKFKSYNIVYLYLILSTYNESTEFIIISDTLKYIQTNSLASFKIINNNNFMTDIENIKNTYKFNIMIDESETFTIYDELPTNILYLPNCTEIKYRSISENNNYMIIAPNCYSIYTYDYIPNLIWDKDTYFIFNDKFNSYDIVSKNVDNLIYLKSDNVYLDFNKVYIKDYSKLKLPDKLIKSLIFDKVAYNHNLIKLFYKYINHNYDIKYKSVLDINNTILNYSSYISKEYSDIDYLKTASTKFYSLYHYITYKNNTRRYHIIKYNKNDNYDKILKHFK